MKIRWPTKTAPYKNNVVRPADPKPGQLKPLEEIEVDYVKLALKICGGNKSKAAKLLRIDRGTLARKLRSQPGEGDRRQYDRKRDRREVVSEI